MFLSWRNSPQEGKRLLSIVAARSHSDTTQSVGLLCMNQPDVNLYLTTQHTTHYTHNTLHSQYTTLTTQHTHNTLHSQHNTLTTHYTHNTLHS